MKTVPTAADIKLAAYNQDPVPTSGLSLSERVLWLTLADIYRQFKSGDLDRQKGDELVRAALSRFSTDRSAEEMKNRLVHAQSQMWKRIELAASAYTKSANRTKEADALFEAVYNCKPKGEVLEE